MTIFWRKIIFNICAVIYSIYSLFELFPNVEDLTISVDDVRYKYFWDHSIPKEGAGQLKRLYLFCAGNIPEIKLHPSIERVGVRFQFLPVTAVTRFLEANQSLSSLSIVLDGHCRFSETCHIDPLLELEAAKTGVEMIFAFIPRHVRAFRFCILDAEAMCYDPGSE